MTDLIYCVLAKNKCSIISVIHGFTFPVDPDKCLLGNFTSSNVLFAKKWKSDTVIKISLWFMEVSNCIPLEKLKSSPVVFFFVLYCLL